MGFLIKNFAVLNKKISDKKIYSSLFCQLRIRGKRLLFLLPTPCPSPPTPLFLVLFSDSHSARKDIFCLWCQSLERHHRCTVTVCLEAPSADFTVSSVISGLSVSYRLVTVVVLEKLSAYDLNPYVITMMILIRWLYGGNLHSVQQTCTVEEFNYRVSILFNIR